MGTSTAGRPSAAGGERAQLEHLALAVEIAGVRAAQVVVPYDRQVVADGMRLHYLDWGGDQAAPIVFLHGGGLTAHTWDLVCLGLRDRHRCYALDLRGHGDSEWSPALDYTVDAHARDLEGLITQLGVRRPVVVGHSLGGYAAIRYASRHSDLLAGLVIVDVSPLGGHSSTLAKLRDFVLGAQRFDTLDEAVDNAIAFNPRRDRRLLRYSLTNALRARPEGGWTWKRDQRHVGDRYFEEVRRTARSLVPELKQIRCPTLVVRGNEGLPETAAAEFASLLPSGRLATVPDSGHNVQGDNPAGLLEVLGPFLAAHNEAAIAQLRDLGARGIDHPGGNLLEHLKRTAAFLADWTAPSELVRAGLYHAVYSTDGFPTRLRTLDQRYQIAEWIGAEAEATVYSYASCDRAFFFSQSGAANQVRFRDRFTGDVFVIGPEALAEFLELTFANELDLLTASPDFAATNGAAITKMLRPHLDVVSPAARVAYLGIAGRGEN